jgi:hydroxymethylbilane synthase
MVREFRVGTRGSLLALTQTRKFVQAFVDAHPEVTCTEVLIQTPGDISTEPLSTSTTPGLFVSTLRESLLRGDVDFIVHSMKDLPVAAHPGIVTACVPEREDSRDGVVSKNNLTLSELPAGAIVGTSSPRRTASLRRVRPDLDIRSIRGNIDTRVEKVLTGDYDATLLAMAGLTRIGRTDVVCEVLNQEEFVPAGGQGALSIECRSDDSTLEEMLATLDDPTTRLTTAAERAVLLGLDAGCATAIGAWATYDSGVMSLTAELGVESTGDSHRVRRRQQLELHDNQSATKLGLAVADELRAGHIASQAAWK